MNRRDTSPNEEGRMDHMRKKLYSPKNDPTGHKHSELHRQDYDVEEDWGHEEEPSNPPTGPEPPEKESSWANKILVFAGVFFTAALVLAGFILLTDSSAISPEKITVSISGPNQVNAGEPLDFIVSVENENAVSLQDAELVLRFPIGTRHPENISEPLPRMRIDLGEIPSGAQIEEEISAMLFGDEDETKEIEVSLEYGVPNSTGIFTVDEEYALDISGSPISLSISSPSEVNSGRDITLELSVVSNTQTVLNDVVVEASYPFGFELSETDPEASYNGSIFRLGDLVPGGERTITIDGRIFGENQNRRVFHFLVGLEDEQFGGEVRTPFATEDQVLTIRRPYLELDIDINSSNDSVSESGVPTSELGDNISGSINWKSNLSSQITNAELVATIQGEAIDRSSVSTEGFYRSSTGRILWNSREQSELSLIEPGDNGSYSFSFDTYEADQIGGQIVNPRLTVAAEITGTAPSEEVNQNTVRSNVTQEILLSTVATVSGETLYYSGPLQTSGPIPPEVDETTTYTIHWEVDTATSDLKDARMTATLPPYVEWEGQTDPGNSEVENISFNPVNGLVVWEIGTVEAGSGYSISSRDVFFTVSITPSDTQTGDTPALLRGTRLDATDAFTGATISEEPRNQLTTNLENDPQAPEDVNSSVE